MSKQPAPFGFLAVDKPPGMTSHDVVAQVRRGTGVRRIGHAGTLDPMATGMLILCVGAATRLSEYIMHGDKLYHATVRLGIETDTYDAEGQVVATMNASYLTEHVIEAALMQFQGEIAQMPPMYSAIKQGGQRLYKMARAGQTVERTPRQVVIYAIHLYEFTPPDARIVVWCSSGTYIRSIAHDLGQLLGVGAHLAALHRRVSGAFNHMIAWEDLLASFEDGTWQTHLRSEWQALPHIPALFLTEAQTEDTQHGRAISREDEIGKSPLRRAYAPDGTFVAILEAHADRWQPLKVFPRAAVITDTTDITDITTDLAEPTDMTDMTDMNDEMQQGDTNEHDG
jgi:tRNA pseudouridine55 synthase